MAIEIRPTRTARAHTLLILELEDILKRLDNAVGRAGAGDEHPELAAAFARIQDGRSALRAAIEAIYGQRLVPLPGQLPAGRIPE